jgi:DNA adenine methylase
VGRTRRVGVIRRPDVTPPPAATPLLKWAGGKRQLLPRLRRFYPPEFGAYLEPFFGSGAVFFDLYSRGLLRDRRAVLIDSNPDLIGCYATVRDRPLEVAASLERLAAGHAAGGRAHYYDVRDRRFNPARDAGRHADGHIDYTPDLAAMLIYLNRTGFNGLYRVNRNGAFNVPAGRYERPKIVDRVKLLAVAEALSAARVELLRRSFDAVDELASAGDFLYIDPPYAPLSPTSNFTSYTAARFDDAEQRALQRLAVRLAHRGCHLLISNSTAEGIRRLYEEDPEAARAGLKATRVPARRAVNSNAARRGPVDELLITNIEISGFQDLRI